MTAYELIDAVHEVGGFLALSGDRIKYAIPRGARWLVAELANQRESVSELLKENAAPPPMPDGIRLVTWNPKRAPIAIVQMGIVTDVNNFVASTLLQLKARLEGKDFLAGNWSQRELIERLEQVGVEVKVDQHNMAGKCDE